MQFEYPWNDCAQKYSSAGTSINKSKMPATFKLVGWRQRTLNADIGGGRYDNATEYLADLGVENVIYDPYNRTPEQNHSALTAIRGGKCDTATVNNVLNVIMEPEGRARVVAQAADVLKPNGVAYFLIYEGDGSGKGKARIDSWQENRKAESYVREISVRFGKVSRNGNLIVATAPLKQKDVQSQS